jgi:hypothetical protein
MNCLKCNTPLVTILYGRPNDNGRRMIDAGERYLGGCMESEDSPTHGCPRCRSTLLDKDSEEYRARMALCDLLRSKP